jgi:hypothetical protein
MNLKEQHDIIEAQLAGKQVMVLQEGAPDEQWVPVARGDYPFDFKNRRYKIEPRRVTCFMVVGAESITQLLAGERHAISDVQLSSMPWQDLDALRRDGRVMVKITLLEP